MTEVRPLTDNEWGWWAGPDDILFSIGPCATKDEAVQEALDTYNYDEVETEDGWRRLVYFAECRGLHYDCDECGEVPKACDTCVDYLDADHRVGGTFRQSRNAGHEFHNYEDEP